MVKLESVLPQIDILITATGTVELCCVAPVRSTSHSILHVLYILHLSAICVLLQRKRIVWAPLIMSLCVTSTQ